MNGLTQRQRTPPPIDRWSARRGPSAGGVDYAVGRTLARGIDDELDRVTTGSLDKGVMWDRTPWMHREERSPVGDGWVNWTEAGPVRPELHMRNMTYRRMAGNDKGRFPYIPGSPTGGMHTMVRPAVAGTVARYQDMPQMRGARVDRLSPARYSGQTYSQVTQLQGGRR